MQKGQRHMTTPVSLSRVLYTAVATATAGRDGRAKSDDGTLDVAVSPPKELGGNGAGTNPEQLFAAGYSACFGSAVQHVAREKRLKTGTVAITAHVSLGPIEGGSGFGLKVTLSAAIPELSRDEGLSLLRAAHEVCPYSNATRGNIQVDLSLE
jgi:Ohr subfamily peroxiredoxin